MVIFIISLVFKEIIQFPILNIIVVLTMTHILSLAMIKYDQKKYVSKK